MIHIDVGESDGRMTFRWSCDRCGVKDQAIQPDEGFDSIVWHLRRYHTGSELRDLAVRMSKGVGAAVQACQQIPVVRSAGR